MSDNAIRVGDLVYVARWPHEHGSEIIGTIWTVRGFATDAICPDCGKTWLRKRWRTIFPESAAVLRGNFGLPLSWLRRIPPLSELDEAEREQEEPIC